MKRAIEKHPECPIEWEPYHDQQFGDIQRSPNRPYEFIPLVQHNDPSRPSLKRISVRRPSSDYSNAQKDPNDSRRLIIRNPEENLRVEFPMKKVIVSESQEGRERDTRYTSPERRPPSYTRYVQPAHDSRNTNNGESSESCPLEDPRNPYHQEYLKLKEKADGELDIKSGVFSPRKQV